MKPPRVNPYMPLANRLRLPGVFGLPGAVVYRISSCTCKVVSAGQADTYRTQQEGRHAPSRHFTRV